MNELMLVGKSNPPLKTSGLIVFTGDDSKLNRQLLFRLCLEQERYDSVLRQTISRQDGLFAKLIGDAPCFRAVRKGRPQRETKLALIVPQNVDEFSAIGGHVRAFFHFADFFPP